VTGPLVIVGAGLAAVRVVSTCRDLGYTGPITVVGEEAELPYDRPPLSKGMLLGEGSGEEIRLATESDWQAWDVELLLGQPAVSLDPGARRVRLDDGTELGYERLVVATGAAPVELAAFADLDRVVYLRDLEDSLRLREALAERPRLGIVGGGFIGLEIAAAATELGCPVTVIEAAAEPLGPILGEELGGVIRAWHEEHGVEFLLGAPVASASGPGRVERIETAAGAGIDVDLAVVGVGARPNVGWLADSGLELHRGLSCDPRGRSSDPNVFGVGDAACRHFGEECVPSGHWTGAGEQARVVAATIVGEPTEPAPVDGYFWSDQYGKRMQFRGRVPAGAELHLLDGSYAERRFAVRCASAGEPCGLLSLDSPREFIRGSIELRRAALAPGVR
jgi:3-phenylpropionate/trans-cinnamate dioxygenase ferredoxin reductase subunit